MRKRITSLLLALVMLLSLVPAMGVTALAAATWDGDGTGTKEDPYLIKTKEQLISSMTEKGKYYALVVDLEFTSDDFADGREYLVGPVTGTYTGEARGYLDGRTHTISGLEIPLVETLNKEGSISNLNLANVSTESAALVMYNNGTIENCAVTETWSIKADANKSGGYLVESNSGTITGCRNTATTQITFDGPAANSDITFTYSGICGGNSSGGTISRCTYNGTVACNGNETSESAPNLFFAGIANSNYGRIETCEYTASLSDFEMNGVALSSAFGITKENRGTIDGCKNSGNLALINEDAYGTYKHVISAGIVGYNYGTVERCTNIGDVAYAGIAYNNGGGYNNGTITECRNEGTVVGYNAGGIAHEMDSSSTPAELTNCVNTGEVKADDTADSVGGGIVAAVSGPHEISGCINRGTVSGTDAGGIVGKLVNYASSEDVEPDTLTTILQKCYNTGVISGIPDKNCSIGGIVGNANSYCAPVLIENVYNVGEIRSNGCETDYGSSVGGIVGWLSNSYSTTEENAEQFDITLENSYSTGVLTSDVKETGSVVGTLYAYLQDGKTPTKLVDNCYALNRNDKAIGAIHTHADEGTQASATLLSADQMGVQDSFTGFDFDTVWSMSTTLNRPYLTALGDDDINNWQEGGSTPEEPGTAKITGLSPQNGATDAGCTAANPPKFYIAFNKKIKIDSANWPQFDFTKEPFRIYRTRDNELIYTATENSFLPGTCADTRVTDSHTQLVITPTNSHILLDPLTDYYITMGEGFVTFEDGSTSPAIAEGEWVFCTGTWNITFNFLCDNDAGVGQSTFEYAPLFFDTQGNTFDLKLAKASLGLAMAAFDYNGSQNIRDLFSKLHLGESFGGGHAFDYHRHTADSICYAIGSAPRGLKEDDYTLIAVSVCGSGYKAEWGGNFNVGAEGDHTGFQRASNEVFIGLVDFIKKYDIKGHIKIWITGYSRSAAVANLTASKLADGKLSDFPDAKDVIFDGQKDLYAYCFATPMGTVKDGKNGNDPKYNSIFNIINPIDPVPKVAPAGWNFGRYGITYCLPSAETEKSNYSDMLMEATKEYTKIMKGTTDTSLLALRQISGQGDILNRFMRVLSNELSRQTYSEQFQASVVTAVETAMKGNVTQQDVASAFYVAIKSNPDLYSQVGKMLLKIIGSKYTWYVIGEQVVEQGLSYLGVPGATAVDTFQELFSVLFFAHHPETTLAWMQAVNKTEDLGYLRDGTGTWYRRLYVNCPVTVSVYDGSGNLLVQLNDDETTHYNNSLLSAYIDGAGQKVVALPMDGDYRVEVAATGDGTVSYSIAECNAATGEVRRTVNYYDIPVQTGDKLTGQVPAEGSGQTNYPLTKDTGSGAGSLTASEDYSGSQVVQHSVTCQVQGNGTVYGDGVFVHGEYAKLTAIPDGGWKFEGWYQGQQLLSRDREYRFRVETDMVLTAKFAAESAPVAPAITTVTLPDGKVGEAYNQTLAATGTTPITWSIEADALPDGLTLVGDTIKGTPSKAGDFKFTVKATNGGGSDTKELTIKIADAEAAKYHNVTLSGAGTGATGAGSHAAGTTVNIYAGTKSGYTFNGWTSDDVTVLSASSKNASFVMPDKDVTVKANWTYDSGSSGGGVTTYPITVKSAKNGDVTASHKTASKGTAVTLTVDPDKGYVLDTLTVLDGKDKELKLTEKNGKYTFTMPDSKVTVAATFKASAPTGKNPFIDVPAGSYYEDAVIWAVDKGITTGTDATHFSPDGICTRAQAVTFLWRTAGSPKPETRTMPFADVPAGSYYYDAVLWAVENGITKGTSETMFSPDATCSRAQIVTFLWRSQKSPAAGTANPFADVKSTAYYADAVLWAVKEDITKGTTSTTFSPDADCTRAQIVTFLWRCKK